MHLSPGTHVGPYEIAGLIGAGGMGEVYRATDPRIRRDVAVKVIRGAAATTDAAARRFELEAQAAGQLSHPNIVTVFDVGTYDGAPYLVTELLQGETLRAKIHRGPIPPRRATEYAAQIANGLAAAHDKGFVHRDLKPNNLFVTPDDGVKILDFGLVKLTEPVVVSMGDDDQTTHTAAVSGAVAGTQGYMSPEQIRGEPVDHRSDIFSLGIVLCEMLSGHHPFRRSSSAETMNATLVEEPHVELPERMPPGLDAIIGRCLEKRPANRFQSAHDLAFSLHEVAVLDSSSSGSSPRHRPPSAQTRTQRRAGVKRAATFLTVVAIVAAAIASGAFLAGRLTARPAPYAFQQLTFRRGLVMSARFAPDGHTIVYGAGWQGKPVALYSMRPDSPESRAFDLPGADILSVSSTGEMAISIGRRYMISFERRGTLARLSLGGGAPREVLTDVDDADWSPDGTTLAVAHVVNGKYRLEYPIGQVLYETDGWLSHVRVARDGAQVAFLDHPPIGDDAGTVCVVGRDRRVKRLTPSWASANGLAWSPDGREIWFTASEVSANCQLYAVDLSGRTRLISQSRGRLILQDVHPSGQVLVTEGLFRTAMMYRREPNGQDTDLSWLDLSLASDISSDAKTVLFAEQGVGAGTQTGTLYMRTVDQAPAVRLGDGTVGALSPDGAWVVALAKGERQTLTLLPTGAGSPARLSVGAIADLETVAWFPGGEHVLLSGSEPGHGVRLYRLAVSGGTPKPISADGIRVFDLSKPVSPDGRRIAALDRAGEVVLQPADGGPASRVAGASSGDIPIGWNADGSALYLFRPNELPARVSLLNLARGQKELVSLIAPTDAAGVTGLTSLLLAPLTGSFVYSYHQDLSSLYLVSGLK